MDAIQSLTKFNVKKITVNNGDKLDRSAFWYITNYNKNKRAKGWMGCALCDSVSEVNIEESIEVIHEEAFNGCKELENINVNKHNSNGTMPNQKRLGAF